MLNASFPCNKLKIWPWSYPTTKRPNTTITAKKPIANFVLSYSATLVFCLDKDIKFFLRKYYIKSWMVYPTSNNNEVKYRIKNGEGMHECMSIKILMLYCL